ncbi:UDP-glucose dehydrogenase family protein [Amycolatopsis anabasis]|uniref:UDP-glucose dehydrogenase family protein n=1 Tax=Amycolatopsis anabasis TaxID=1840409 RepID=UPI00131D9102|nr:UDP-glucose/GDP-mannose dehydrogenase family protein [Amycolatopsis anabasis]
MGSELVGVLGVGYVGLTTAACFASLGHRVVAVDVDQSKVDELGRGVVSIGEPGLDDMVRAGLAAGRLRFTTELRALADAGTVLLCLPTPMGEGGVADLGALSSALGELAPILRPGCVLVTKSTVPVGTAERIPGLLGRTDVPVVSNPEFLREGHAVHDFLHPDRIVLGSADPDARDRVRALYASLDAPVVVTGTASAELAKYASNAFLALRLSYVNVLAELCENLGADVTDVTATMGLDPRIGADFLAPGPGWGGSCLPKDTSALACIAAESGVDFALLRAAVDANAHQRERIVRKVRRAAGGSLAGARIGLLGLAFKAGTDDLRHSPALEIARELARRGAVLTGYDPGVPPSARVDPVHLVDDPVLVAKDAAAIVLLTEWPEFRDLDWAQLAEVADRRAVVDTRNLLDPDQLTGQGFSYTPLGR